MSHFLKVIPLLVVASVIHAQETQPSQRIDALVEASCKQHNVKPNPPTNDEVFVRRIYLDAVGRIPTKDELTEFLSNQEPAKRSKLIDKLLNSEGFVSHTYNWWADILRIQTQGGGNGAEVGQAYASWLKKAIRNNMPYDQFVRELITARGHVWDNGAVGYYIRDAGMPLDNMSNTAQVFLGTRVVCAQCHNHPFDHWKQKDYYEMAAFTYGVDTQMTPYAINPELENIMESKGKKAARRAERKGGRQSQDVRALENMIKEILEPLSYGVSETKRVLKLPSDYKYDDAKPDQEITAARALFAHDRIDKQAPPQKLGGDMREHLADWLCNKQNPRFTTVIVNRIWKRAMGVGMIEPVDDFKDDTLAFNQPLMKFLCETFVREKYDMRKMFRHIYNSRTYQRECTPGDVSLDTPYYFPGPILRRMSAEQAWDSLVTLMIPNPDLRKKSNDYQGRLTKMKEAADVLKKRYVDTKRAGAVDLIALATAMQDASKANEAKLRTASEGLQAARTKKDEKAAKTFQEEIQKLTREQQSAVAKAQAEAEKEIDEKRKSSGGLPPKPLAMDTSVKKDVMSPMNKMEPSKAVEEPRVSAGEYAGYSEAYYRASELPSPAPAGHFLYEFGQSERLIIENSWNDASVTQALSLMNGQIFEELTGKNSQLNKALEYAVTPTEKATKLWLTVLGRNPTPQEKQIVTDVTKGQGQNSWKEVFWALLNGREFIFIQ